MRWDMREKRVEGGQHIKVEAGESLERAWFVS
jgi:hypothetical protein